MLEKCPICGNLPVLQSTDKAYKYFCGVHVSCGDWKPTIEKAEEDWNRRTTDKLQPDLYALPPQTNADYVRSMTDEELANLLSGAWNKCDYETGDYDPSFLEWLRQPKENTP